MELRVVFKDSLVCLLKTDQIPAVGSTARFKTQYFTAGLNPGSIIEIVIAADNPPLIDFSQGSQPVACIDASECHIVSEGRPVE